jgi:hypothetical protein
MQKFYPSGGSPPGEKALAAISHGLWLRVTLQFDPRHLRDDEAYAYSTRESGRS